MDHLVYKGFTFPRNPSIYRQSYTRKPLFAEDETGRTVFIGLGGLKHIITGSGVFSGETAYEDFSQLAALCNQVLAGPLVHPVWGTVSAFLTELEMEQESRENYVAYSFTFQVADGNGVLTQ